VNADGALVIEALRIYQRYAVEIVEGLGLCPWAEHARQTGRVTVRAVLARERDVAPVLGLIDEYAANEQVEILIALFPVLAIDRRGFEHFVAEVREADAKRHELGTIPFAMAAFHPDANPELDAPERLIPFLRRSPDPTIQLVRRTVLERVRERSPEGTGFVDLRLLDPKSLQLDSTPTLREKIAEANLSTVRRLGVAEVERLLAEIRRDRDQSYARVLSDIARDPG
jgi:hypothetical protein